MMNYTKLEQTAAETKQKHPDAVILFRTGDYYTVVKEDAAAVSEISDLPLYTEDGGGFFCMFLHANLDAVLPKIIRAGRRVAIIDGF